MKKIFSSLPVKLLIGIVIGIIFGQIFPENVMSVVVPLKNILGQVINFLVPINCHRIYCTVYYKAWK